MIPSLARLTHAFYYRATGSTVAAHHRSSSSWGDLRKEGGDDSLLGPLGRSFVNRPFLDAYGLDRERMDASDEQWRRFRPAALRRDVTPLVLFARHLLDGGIDTVRPAVVLTGAEPLFEPQHRVLTEAVHCPVRNSYGGRDTSHMAVAAAGQAGEVVITDLKKTAMPLIRCRLEDVAVPADGVCPCGRGLPLLERVEGRLKDVIVTARGSLLAAGIFTHVLMDQPVGKFQVQQRETTGIVVRIVPGAEFHAGVTEVVKRRLRCFVGEPFEIRFVTVPSIELGPTGKHRCVVSEVSAGSDP